MMSKLIKYLKSFAWGCIDVVAKCSIRLGILKRFVLIRPDGGLCSQMHFYMIGSYFNNQGFNVKYTLEWFEKNGFDMNYQYVYNFDLIKAFPSLNIQVASRFETLLYHAFVYRNDYYDKTTLYDWFAKRPPVYLNGYFNTPKDWYNSFSVFFSVDYSVLDAPNSALLNEIVKKENSVAVHVRLGDLSTFHSAYGEPASVRYFRKAIDYVENASGNCFYYFFSVDPNWVRDNLIPKLDLDNNYSIVDLNGSDRGYMDLLLISACNNQITSKGSLGKYAGFLHQSKNNIIVIVDDEYERSVWDGSDDRIVFIKDR